LSTSKSHVDVTLIGGGIMSATLGMLLKVVRPDASITLYERLDQVGLESSDPWNNAGTGHAALCELHYTPERPDGSIDIRKAMLVSDQFQLSLQFYSWLVEQGIVSEPESFINPIPHVGFTRGERNVDFLRRRHAALEGQPPFSQTVFSDDRSQIEAWLPLMMAGRESAEPVAVTRSENGTDVNFGSLTKHLVNALRELGADVRTRHEAQDLRRSGGNRWDVTVKDLQTGEKRSHTSGFVFVGAGGTAIHLLQKSGIPEIKGVGGFPVSGQFLRCTNPDLIAKHHAKVYGRPATGAPPMTAPHLDTRMIDGNRGILFGPFAGFTPKFLKKGSNLDLARSIRPDNILTMLSVARHEMPLTRYLIQQVLQSKSARVDYKRSFVPLAEDGDWEIIQAGQRVQVMRPTPKSRGILQFGTEVITSRDGTMAGLLGASPGASTATAIILDVIERCFPDEMQSWQPALRDVIPSAGVERDQDPV
jgi:malate dehydrogenase (quinone)